MALQLDEVVCRYGQRTAVDRLSLTLKTGATALIGRNGAGKSTLIRAIATVALPQIGDIRWDGQSVLLDSPARRSYRRGLGWVPQAVSFPRGVRVRSYLEHAAWLRMVPRSSTRAVTELAAERADVAHLLGRRIETLSGGMRQRVVLAGAILADPTILLLDEPTVGLDPEQRADFMRVVAGLTTRTVVIISTHILEDVTDVANRAILLDHGSLAQDLEVDERTTVAELRSTLFPGTSSGGQHP